jgi:pyridoxine 5-phosphate synthase
VSLFIDPDEQQIDAAVSAGAPVIELHTGAYTDASNQQQRKNELERLFEWTVFSNISWHCGLPRLSRL